MDKDSRGVVSTNVIMESLENVFGIFLRFDAWQSKADSGIYKGDVIILHTGAG